MCPEVLGHLRKRLQYSREDSRVRPDERICRIDDVCVDRSIVRIDYYFDAVPHVARFIIELLRVWITIGGSIAVENPLELSVAGYCEIWIAIESQERQRESDALVYLAVVENPAAVFDIAGKQNVERAEMHREDCARER